MVHSPKPNDRKDRKKGVVESVKIRLVERKGKKLFSKIRDRKGAREGILGV
jgi:hypothetical protein